MKPTDRRLIYALVFLSGCSGLIYEVVWHRYLGVLLGAHARATSIVLAVFLGGISAGYHVFGNWSRSKRWNLLRAYALVELGLGIWALAFPYLFRALMPMTAKLYLWMGVNNIAVDVLLSVVLMGLPTFLMGGTLPLLTQSLSRDLSDASQTHARIYGFNTIGACAGSVLAGYILIPFTSLPAAVAIGGTLNILVAGIVEWRHRKWLPATDSFVAPPSASPAAWNADHLVMLLIGTLSGFTLITLETVLIRLVGLSTGSSPYNFTLIVSIFIFALGFSSLLAGRIGQYRATRLFWNQLAGCVFLLLLYRSGDHWPYWVHLIRITFQSEPYVFYVYQAALGLFFLALLVLPIGLCGLTLPLCFHLLKDHPATLGKRVGQLYGVNTLGCVLGALIGGYELLDYFNLDQVFKLCLGVTLFSAACAAFLCRDAARKPGARLALGGATFAGIALAIWTAPLYVKARFLQPFRLQSATEASLRGVEAFTGALARDKRFLVHRDGPNATIAVTTEEMNEGRHRTVFVNGKSDGDTFGDYFTMMMTGDLPGLLSPKLDRIAVVGFGTGISIGHLARYAEASRIDVAEISGTLIENRHWFDPFNGGVSRDPKVHLHEMDAFRYLEGVSGSFDLIVSEPSNPWVTGVENLYTREYYEIVRRKLAPEGMFAQWVQGYSFNGDLFRMVLKTLNAQFPYVYVFQMLENDYLLLGLSRPLDRGDLRRAEARFHGNPAVQSAFRELGITRLESVLAREFLPSPVVPLLAKGATEQRLEAPRLSHEAAKAYFQGRIAEIAQLRKSNPAYYPAMVDSLLHLYLEGRPLAESVLPELHHNLCENERTRAAVLCSELVFLTRWNRTQFQVTAMEGGPVSSTALASLARIRNRKASLQFTADDLAAVKSGYQLFSDYYSPLARLSAVPLLQPLERCLNGVDRRSPLYGDCLLLRILVLERTRPYELRNAIPIYQTWLSTLPADFPSHAKFESAGRLLKTVEGT